MYDCMMGDATLFQRADRVEASWKVIQPILDTRKGLPSEPVPSYGAGCCGPSAADEWLALRPAKFTQGWGRRLPVSTDTIANNREVMILPDANAIVQAVAMEIYWRRRGWQ